MHVGASKRVTLPVVGSPSRLAEVEVDLGTMFWVRATASSDLRSAVATISPRVIDLKTVPGGFEIVEEKRTTNVVLRSSDWALIPLPAATSRLTGAKEVVDAKTGKKRFELVRNRLAKQPDRVMYLLVKCTVIVQREEEEEKKVPATSPG